MKPGFTTSNWNLRFKANSGNTLILHPKEFKQTMSVGKVMASVFWDSECVIMIDYLEKKKLLMDSTMHQKSSQNAEVR